MINAPITITPTTISAPVTCAGTTVQAVIYTGSVIRIPGPQGEQGLPGDDGLTVSVNAVSQVNGDITLGKADLGLGNVTNDAQVTAVSGTAPIVSSGGTTPAISIAAATTSAAGSLSAADKAKLDGISGINTGDETASTIKAALGITTLSGSNTGDQAIPTTLPASDVSSWAKAATKPTYTAAEVGASATSHAHATSDITGFAAAALTAAPAETASTIKAALGITTLSGSNTGDQAIPTTLPASDVSSWAKAATKPTYTAAEVGASATSHAHATSDITGFAAAALTAAPAETASTIKAALGITTLSGSNTGDQAIPTTLPASDVSAWAKSATKPTYTATELGLGNADNTSDANKPVSTAQQTALNLKANLASPTFTGTLASANTSYTGTLTGSTDILNIGSGQIYKDAAGNVGIGNTPVTKLHVKKSAADALHVTNGTIFAEAASLADGVGSSVSFGFNSWQFSSIKGYSEGGGTFGGGLQFWTAATNSAWHERMRIDSSGNVGIGCTPSSKLDIGSAFNAGPLSTLTFSGLNSAAVKTNYVQFVPIVEFNPAGSEAGGFILKTLQNGAYKNSIVASGALVNSTNYLAFSTTNEAMRIDSSGNVLVTGSGGLGYGTGSGGTVTQATSKGTAVTLNKPCGTITMNGAALAAGAVAGFALNSTVTGSSDACIVNIKFGSVADPGSYNVWAVPTSTGPLIYVKNISGVSLSEAIVINFAIIKGATS